MDHSIHNLELGCGGWYAFAASIDYSVDVLIRLISGVWIFVSSRNLAEFTAAFNGQVWFNGLIGVSKYAEWTASNDQDFSETSSPDRGI